MIRSKTANLQKYGSYGSILYGRRPSALSELYNSDGDEVGNIEFFVTPLGIALSLIVSMPERVGLEETYHISIAEKKENKGEETWLMHRAKVLYLPSISVKDGCGYLTFFTELFGLCEIIGGKISLRLKDSPVASGEIVAASY